MTTHLASYERKPSLTTVLDNATHPLRSLLGSEHLPEAFLFVTAAAALGIGGTLIGLPLPYLASPTLREAFTYGPPWLWGLAMIIPAVVVGAAAVLRRYSAIWPCIVLAVVWSLWGLASIPAVASGRGVPSGLIIYSTIGVLTGLSGILARVWDDRPRP